MTTQDKTAAKPTDAQILDALRGRGRTMTYVIRNILSYKHSDLKTDFVRRRLMALESAGHVKRVPSSYVSQICWQEVTAQ